MKVAVIGGGAAGFFAAIAAKTNHPEATVAIIEKTKKLLSKVRISGGGRCNVTNGNSSIKILCDGYPRGQKLLKKAFRIFSTTDTKAWFEDRGVPLKTEIDNRVFPVSDDSASIVQCLMNEVKQLGITIEKELNVTSILNSEKGLILHVKNNTPKTYSHVIIASGGTPKIDGLLWLQDMGHTLMPPVPSLFTFNMPDENVKKLMGVVAKNARIKIQGSKLSSEGPILITHWGMSGPAILKLSSLGARILNEKGYKFKIDINWVNEKNNELVSTYLQNLIREHPKKKLSSVKPYGLPERLWLYLLTKCELSHTKLWLELGKKGIHKLVNILTHDTYSVMGKTTFKEEFVTCGGVSLSSIHPETMQSRSYPNLYFAGEVLDIDGITGGYNFQAAWTTAYIAGQLG